MSATLNKELLCTEDIVLSLDITVEQSRGIMTPFNAFKLPYNTTELTVGTALNERYTKSESLAIFAKFDGDNTVAFKVFDAINPTEAISKQQLDAMVTDTLVVKDEVLTKTNDIVYVPLADYNPATKLFVDESIYNRFVNGTSGSFTSADGKTVTVVGGLITGIL